MEEINFSSSSQNDRAIEGTILQISKKRFFVEPAISGPDNVLDATTDFFLDGSTSVTTGTI